MYTAFLHSSIKTMSHKFYAAFARTFSSYFLFAFKQVLWGHAFAGITSSSRATNHSKSLWHNSNHSPILDTLLICSTIFLFLHLIYVNYVLFFFPVLWCIMLRMNRRQQKCWAANGYWICVYYCLFCFH